MAESVAFPESEFVKLEKTLWENLDETSDDLKETSSELSDYTKEIVKVDKKEKNVAGAGKKRPWLTAWEKTRFRNIASLFSFENLKAIKDWSASSLAKTKMTIANVGTAVADGFAKTKSLYHRIKTSWWTKLLLIFGGLFLFWDKIKETLTNMWEGLDEDTKANAKAMLDGVLEIFRDVGNVIKESVGNVFGNNGLVAALTAFFRGDVTPMLRSLFTLLTTTDDDKKEAYSEEFYKRTEYADKARNAVHVYAQRKDDLTDTRQAEKFNKSMNRVLVAAKEAGKEDFAKKAIERLAVYDKDRLKEFKKEIEKNKALGLDTNDLAENQLAETLIEFGELFQDTIHEWFTARTTESADAYRQIGWDAAGILKKAINEAVAEKPKIQEEAERAKEAERAAAEESLKQKSLQEITDYGKVIASFNRLDEMIAGWKEGVINLGVQIDAKEIAVVLKDQFVKISEHFQRDLVTTMGDSLKTKNIMQEEIEKTTKTVAERLSSMIRTTDDFTKSLTKELTKISDATSEKLEKFAESASKTVKILDDYLSSNSSNISKTFDSILVSQRGFFREIYNIFARMTLNPTVEADSAQIEVTTQKGNQIDNSKIEDIKATINVNKADLGSLEKSIQSMNVMQQKQIDELSKQNASLTNIISALGGFNSSAQVLQKTLSQQSNQKAATTQNFILSSGSDGKASLYSPLALKQSQITTALAFQS